MCCHHECEQTLLDISILFRDGDILLAFKSSDGK